MLIILSFASTYIIWGSTYLFSSYAIEEIPAFRVCGYRYTAAGLIILAFFGLKGVKEKPTKLELINTCKAGFIFLGLGTGGAIWALNFLDTGLTALIIAGEPLLIVFLIWLIKKRPPARQTFLGIFLGILGMYLLVSQSTLVSGDDQWIGVLVIFLSMLAWGIGSIFVNDAPLPSLPFLNSGLQMLVGGIATFAISFLIGEQSVPIYEVSNRTLYSLLYLIVFGSIIAFTAFNYLLKNVATEKVVTNTYINPIIAMGLGYYFKDEIITNQSILAAMIMILGVFIINTNRLKKK
ncbi:EamA family transporter [Saprospiraceae bacterium]|nr:EamA family transporter [Saprospiraceae bacterium]